MILFPGAGICGQHEYETIAAPVTAIVQVYSNIQSRVVVFRYRSKSTKTSIDINGSLRGRHQQGSSSVNLGDESSLVLKFFGV